MVAVLYSQGGGLTAIIAGISSGYAAHVAEASRPSLLAIVSVVFMTSFGPWGLPQMVQKFYAIKDEKVIRTAAIVTTVFALIIGASAYFVGVSSHAFFSLESVPRSEGGAILFDSIVPTLLTTRLPEALMALILLLVLSASMSTLSTLVLVSFV